MKPEKPAKGGSAFLTDLDTIRRRARQQIEEGAVTQGYEGDSKTVVKLLNDALATEIVCVFTIQTALLHGQGTEFGECEN
jgi:bacterioferritin